MQGKTLEEFVLIVQRFSQQPTCSKSMKTTLLMREDYSSINHLRRVIDLGSSIGNVLLRFARLLDQWRLEHLVILCADTWGRAV